MFYLKSFYPISIKNNHVTYLVKKDYFQADLINFTLCLRSKLPLPYYKVQNILIFFLYGSSGYTVFFISIHYVFIIFFSCLFQTSGVLIEPHHSKLNFPHLPIAIPSGILCVPLPISRILRANKVLRIFQSFKIWRITSSEL